MPKLRKFMAGVAVFTSIMATSAHADSVVKVSLIDKTGAADMSQSMALGMGMKGDMSSAKMGIGTDRKVVDRGKVRFDIVNLASTLVHEVIVAPVIDENQVLAYDEAKTRVDQDTIKTLGQISEIDPNKSASMTLELKPGKYVLYCNLPGHYMAGMWTVIEVK